ncbi:MAG TPA: 6-phosphogluconolactonase [Pyrinomonadaceae bacterium]|nr:6-phosphogluconolactonase [Pyrinomonadaceae bacterium]
MKTSEQRSLSHRETGGTVWLESGLAREPILPNGSFQFRVLETEDAVGGAMLGELLDYAANKAGDVNIILLGGRGAQAMYKQIRARIGTVEIDELLSRLNVFTQDALAPMRMANGLSFVRDFERLLGDQFFSKIKSFTPMLTETDDVESALTAYLDKLESLGGIDLFFLGLGPEANAASHLCYIKPGSGATFKDVAGVIPISSSILEHHVSKFRAGGSDISAEDEAECRAATHILTLGPAAILSAKKIVQSIVDASTAPAKVQSFARMIETAFAEDPVERAKQLDENPGLWIRLHPNVTSFVLPDLLER